MLVNCVATDRPDEMKAALERFTSNVEYTFDKDLKLTNHLGATSTTDVFVLDQSYTVIYHGAIDDQYGFGYSIDTPRYYLSSRRVGSFLEHRPVLVSATAAPGCLLETRQTATASSEITYHNQISRLLQRHCVECHREGGVGPFALDTYEDAIAHAPMIREVVHRGIMPPWFAAPDKNHTASPWINDRSLSVSEKQQLFAWLDNKMPAGEPKQSPAPRTFEDGWLIGKPDAVFQFTKPVKVKATGTMPYQNVIIDTHLESDRWVQAIEVQPEDRSVVHHVLVFVQGVAKRMEREMMQLTKGRVTGVFTFPEIVPWFIPRVMPNVFRRERASVSKCITRQMAQPPKIARGLDWYLQRSPRNTKFESQVLQTRASGFHRGE